MALVSAFIDVSWKQNYSNSQAASTKLLVAIMCKDLLFPSASLHFHESAWCEAYGEDWLAFESLKWSIVDFKTFVFQTSEDHFSPHFSRKPKKKANSHWNSREQSHIVYAELMFLLHHFKKPLKLANYCCGQNVRLSLSFIYGNNSLSESAWRKYET